MWKTIPSITISQQSVSLFTILLIECTTSIEFTHLRVWFMNKWVPTNAVKIFCSLLFFQFFIFLNYTSIYINGFFFFVSNLKYRGTLVENHYWSSQLEDHREHIFDSYIHRKPTKNDQVVEALCKLSFHPCKLNGWKIKYWSVGSLER